LDLLWFNLIFVINWHKKRNILNLIHLI